MGVFSNLNIQEQEECYRSDFSYPSRVETLTYFLEDMNDALAGLKQGHSYDAHRGQSGSDEANRRYYENPETYFNLLCEIAEVEKLIRTLSPCSAEREIIMSVAVPTVGVIGLNAERTRNVRKSA